jgi:hypothetical protein
MFQRAKETEPFPLLLPIGRRNNIPNLNPGPFIFFFLPSYGMVIGSIAVH